MNKLFLLFVAMMFACFEIHAQEKSRDQLIIEETEENLKRSEKYSDQFYKLEDGADFKEITQAILASDETKASMRLRILTSGRRFFLFKYPSDGIQVKGYISFVPNPFGNPLLIFLRGGNRMFALQHPAADVTSYNNYTVIATAYRGGVSEGTDQFGGDDVNDVENLVHFIPELERKLGLIFNPEKVFMLGVSRGAMQMFQALGRSPFLQNYVSKAVALSGLLDMRECMRDREDMKQMFVDDFGLIPKQNEEEWIERRDPIAAIPNIRKDLPFLIIEGTDDIRTSSNEKNHMLQKLKENGNSVDYLEITGGDHCLSNRSDRMEWIANWLELEF